MCFSQKAKNTCFVGLLRMVCVQAEQRLDPLKSVAALECGRLAETATLTGYFVSSLVKHQVQCFWSRRLEAFRFLGGGANGKNKT